MEKSGLRCTDQNFVRKLMTSWDISFSWLLSFQIFDLFFVFWSDWFNLCAASRFFSFNLRLFSSYSSLRFKDNIWFYCEIQWQIGFRDSEFHLLSSYLKLWNKCTFLYQILFTFLYLPSINSFLPYFTFFNKNELSSHLVQS